jgi:hypothetical protein
MAARRLIAILLVMLFLALMAAALAPVDGERDESGSTGSTSTTSPVATPPPGSSSRGELIKQSIDASGSKPSIIRAVQGDQLQLRVTSTTPGTVEIPGLSPTEDVGPEQPAFFDILFRGAGKYSVRFLESRREIARIEVVGSEARAPSP